MPVVDDVGPHLGQLVASVLGQRAALLVLVSTFLLPGQLVGVAGSGCQSGGIAQSGCREVVSGSGEGRVGQADPSSLAGTDGQAFRRQGERCLSAYPGR